LQTTKAILPAQTIGIIGGGQLGRMMAIAARYMGYKIAVLDPTSDCPTAQIADKQLTAAYDDRQAIKELTEISDVVTYEFENVDLDAAAYIEKTGKLPQGAFSLEITQNREKEKRIMQEEGLPVAPFAIVKNAEECVEALEHISFPSVIKTCSGGYDGKGQIKLNSSEDKQEAMDFAEENKHCIIEKWVPFDKEISIVFTRSMAGDITFFPIAQNEHRNHVLYQTTVPAAISENAGNQVRAAAEKLAERMNIVGTFAIEMFVSGESIYLNEMAPRPHNSGHFTIEACNISQFAQHIRAVCGLPLADIELLQPAVMINILGEDLDRTLTAMPRMKNAFIHLYGKAQPKVKRKMGHVTFIAETEEKLYHNMQQLKEEMK